MTHFIKIISYRAAWNLDKHTGKLELYKREKTKSILLKEYDISNPAEYAAILDVLRNEKPIWFNVEKDIITSGLEPPGEEET